MADWSKTELFQVALHFQISYTCMKYLKCLRLQKPHEIPPKNMDQTFDSCVYHFWPNAGQNFEISQKWLLFLKLPYRTI